MLFISLLHFFASLLREFRRWLFSPDIDYFLWLAADISRRASIWLFRAISIRHCLRWYLLPYFDTPFRYWCHYFMLIRLLICYCSLILIRAHYFRRYFRFRQRINVIIRYHVIVIFCFSLRLRWCFFHYRFRFSLFYFQLLSIFIISPFSSPLIIDIFITLISLLLCHYCYAAAMPDIGIIAVTLSLRFSLVAAMLRRCRHITLICCFSLLPFRLRHFRIFAFRCCHCVILLRFRHCWYFAILIFITPIAITLLSLLPRFRHYCHYFADASFELPLSRAPAMLSQPCFRHDDISLSMLPLLLPLDAIFRCCYAYCHLLPFIRR